MCAMASSERRQTRRYPVAASLRLLHDPSQRNLPARSIDASTDGMFMFVPATTPVKAGQPIHVTFGQVARAELSDLSDKTLPACVVRVDRKSLLVTGHLAVGVRFDREPDA